MRFRGQKFFDGKIEVSANTALFHVTSEISEIFRKFSYRSICKSDLPTIVMMRMRTSKYNMRLSINYFNEIGKARNYTFAHRERKIRR